MTDVTIEELLTLVSDGHLTLLHRPEWLSEQVLADLHMANAGCTSAAIRLAAALAPDWTWRVGYDGAAHMVWRPNTEFTVQVISLGPAHALTIAVLQTMLRAKSGVLQPAVEEHHGLLEAERTTQKGD